MCIFLVLAFSLRTGGLKKKTHQHQMKEWIKEIQEFWKFFVLEA